MSQYNGYTCDAIVAKIESDGYLSTSTSLGSQDIVNKLNESFYSYLVPLITSQSEEFFIDRKTIKVTSDQNSQITLPDSVSSSLRTVTYYNNGNPYNLTRIDPKDEVNYIGQQQTQYPYGYMLTGFTMTLLPKGGPTEVHLRVERRPSEIVLNSNAGQITAVSGSVLTLNNMPIAWQESAPTLVDVVSDNSPFSPLVTQAQVASVTGTTTLTLQNVSASDLALIVVGSWVADPDCSPYANIPKDWYLLLQLDVVCSIMQTEGDQRLKGLMQRKDEIEKRLMRTMAPRTIGSVRPIVNYSAPGMGMGRRWGR